MINAHLIQHGCMQIMDRYALFHGPEAEFVGTRNICRRIRAGSPFQSTLWRLPSFAHKEGLRRRRSNRGMPLGLSLRYPYSHFGKLRRPGKHESILFFSAGHMARESQPQQAGSRLGDNPHTTRPAAPLLFAGDFGRHIKTAKAGPTWLTRVTQTASCQIVNVFDITYQECLGA